MKIYMAQAKRTDMYNIRRAQGQGWARAGKIKPSQALSQKGSANRDTNETQAKTIVYTHASDTYPMHTYNSCDLQCKHHMPIQTNTQGNQIETTTKQEQIDHHTVMSVNKNMTLGIHIMRTSCVNPKYIFFPHSPLSSRFDWEKPPCALTWMTRVR